MTKIQMPEPVAYAIKAANTGKVVSVCLASDAGFQGVDLMAQEHVNPLITTDQAEAYKDACVRQVLEEAAEIADQHNDFSTYDAIRALIPKE